MARVCVGGVPVGELGRRLVAVLLEALAAAALAALALAASVRCARVVAFAMGDALVGRASL